MIDEPETYQISQLLSDLQSLEHQQERLQKSSANAGFGVPAIRKGSIEEAQLWSRMQYQQMYHEHRTATFGRPGMDILQLAVDGEWGESLHSRHIRILRSRYCEANQATLQEVNAIHLMAFATWVAQAFSKPNQTQRKDSEPVEILTSIAKFRNDHPNPSTTAFLIMRFGATKAHEASVKAIRDAFSKHGITVVRADEREYHSHLYFNILTYMHGCGIGVALFERIESNDLNPNVSLEVGYMLAQRNPVCLLKDQTLKSLPTDLVGTLYKDFDTQSPGRSIQTGVTQWVSDQGLIKLT